MMMENENNCWPSILNHLDFAQNNRSYNGFVKSTIKDLLRWIFQHKNDAIMDMLFSSNQHCQGLKLRQHAFRSSRWLRWGSLEMRIDELKL